MSSPILGIVQYNDTVLATRARERSGSWMKLVDWGGQGARWICRGDGDDDVLQFVGAARQEAVVECEADITEDESSAGAAYDDESDSDECSGSERSGRERSSSGGSSKAHSSRGRSGKRCNGNGCSSNRGRSSSSSSSECEASGEVEVPYCSMDYSQ